MLFDGTVSAATMSGTYTTSCEAPTGSWTVSKS